jgi:prevent-host-death family protein
VFAARGSEDEFIHSFIHSPTLGKLSILEQRMNRTIAVSVAREQITDILDDAEKGNTTLILRHSKPSAAVVPARDLDTFKLFQRVMREVGETLEISRDPAIIAAVAKARDEINRGKIILDEE